MVTVDELYSEYDVLATAQDKATEHESSFMKILSGVSGGVNEKRLASQFITKFIRYFPSKAEEALNAMFDLCEDENPQVRKQAVKDLPLLCREIPALISRVSDALAQLLLQEDPQEQSLVQHALSMLLGQDARATLEGLFTQVGAAAVESGEETIRGRAIQFMALRVPEIQERGELSREAEDQLVASTRRTLQDVTADEFMALVRMLSALRSLQTLQGRQTLVDIIAEQADLDKPFQATEAESYVRVSECLRIAQSLFSKNVPATRFLQYMLGQVLPVIFQVPDPHQVSLLRALADMTSHIPPAVELELSPLLNTLLQLMPEQTENTPDLNFSAVECLLMALHQLGRRNPSFLQDKHTEFKRRGLLFASAVQQYMRQLRVNLQQQPDAAKTEEGRLKVVALRCTSNVDAIMKDLLHSPPIYKAEITPSWRTRAEKRSAAAAAAATGEDAEKAHTPSKMMNRPARSLYAPPSGKFSERAGAPPRGGVAPRGRGRGRRFRRF